MRLELGTSVHSSEGDDVGALADVVIDPVEKRVTHLVVQPHKHGESRLVSIDYADSAVGRSEIVLRCSREELDAFPTVDEFSYLRLGDAALVDDPDWDVGVTNVLALPYYDGSYMLETAVYEQNLGVAFDRIPKGEVEVRRTSSVLTSDGRYIGDVDGFLVDDDEHITHFVLERGHLWGRREVTIPIGAVEKVETDTITISLSESEIEQLPAHRVHRWLVFGRG
jgi:sporulation protein YlmC with PRC-barrel domain